MASNNNVEEQQKAGIKPVAPKKDQQQPPAAITAGSGAGVTDLNPTTNTDETGFKRVPINVNDPEKQQSLIELNWYLGIANPVYVKSDIKIEKLQNGNTVTDTIKKSVFDHFEYPNVGGNKFDEWLAKTFGPDVKVDPKTKEVYTLVSDKDAPAPQPNPTNK
jgi:hypothetical protein